MGNLALHLKELVEDGASLSQEQAAAALREMLEGEASDIAIAALLTAMATRGATAAELTGFVQAMRERLRPIPLSAEERAQLVDTCGTGGGCGDTFNISTGAALASAAAGVKVAKHGNRGVTSRSGSADVLEAMGIPIDLEPEQAAACLRATGFMFLMAPSHHPAMKRVQPVRRALGFRTIFNLAGPLCNPAGAEGQVLGVYGANAVSLVSETLARLNARHAFVVHGRDGLDELTLNGISDAAEVRGRTVRLFQMSPADAGLESAPLSAVRGGDARENAALLESILRGEKSPARDVVLLNAAAAAIVAGLAPDFTAGAGLVAEALDSGAGIELLERLRRWGARHPRPAD